MIKKIISELRLWLANHVISKIPLNCLRMSYYRRLMKFQIGRESFVLLNCRFDCAGGLTIGENSTINDQCFFDTRGGITIGNCVAITSGVWIITVKHDLNSSDFSAITEAVEIGDYAFIGRRAIILQGCRVGRGAVLGAGAVLTRSIPDFEIWAGNPAKKIGDRDQRNFSYVCNYSRLFH